MRLPDEARKQIEECFKSSKAFACGLLVSALNPIAVFTNPEQVPQLTSIDI